MFIFKTLTHVDIKPCDPSDTRAYQVTRNRIIDKVRINKLETYYFCFDHDITIHNNDNTTPIPIYKVKSDFNDIEIVGYYFGDSQLNFNINLYAKTFVEKYKDLFLIMDGREVEIDPVPNNIAGMIRTETVSVSQEIFNPIPANGELVSEVGNVVVSGFHIVGLPQSVFYPLPEPDKDVLFNEQWVSDSSDLTAEQFIGYEFDNADYILKSIKIIPRTGPTDTPALLGPTPQQFYIDGKLDGVWVPITSQINLKSSNWVFMAPIELNLGKDNNVAYSGFRIRIVKWNPGHKKVPKDTHTGLYRVEFLVSKPNEPIEIRTYPTLNVQSDDVVYAAMNALKCDYPVVLEEHGSTTTDEFVELQASNIFTNIELLYDKTDITFSDDLVGIEGQTNLYIVVGKYKIVFSSSESFTFNTPDTNSYNVTSLTASPGTWVLETIKDNKRYVSCIEGNRIN